MTDHAAKAAAFFDRGDFLCAESVFLTLAPLTGQELGLPGEAAARLATGFCSGLGRNRGLCGAVSGAVLALGLALGRSAPRGDLDPCYAAVTALLEGFVERFGSSNCQELTGLDFGNPADLARYRAENGKVRCLDYIRAAVDLGRAELAEAGMLQEHGS